MKKKSMFLYVATAVVMLIVALVFFMTITRDSGASYQTISVAQATADLEKLLKHVDVTAVEVQPEQLDVSEFLDVGDELPDIDASYPLVVEGNGRVDIEIFTTGEKGAKSGTDSFLTQMAQEFNKGNHKTEDGKTMSVSLRSVPAGTAAEYIIYGKASPAAYSPSNELLGNIVAANGIDIALADDCVVGNVAGILVSSDTKEELEEAYGKVDFETVVQATIDGVISMGYSNPQSSSTGLNFLLTLLHNADPDDMLSNKAVERFLAFQANVPIVSITTQQMTSSAEKGIIDGLVSEYQTYVNDAALSRKYEFIPFGVIHNNPLYSVGTLSADESSCLEAFIDYYEGKESVAKKNGFNQYEGYTGEAISYDGAIIEQAQDIWTEEKDAGVTVVAEFIVDVSGSMNGEPIQNLKTAMLNSIQYISDENYIGLLTFDDSVYQMLPIDEFDITQKTLFKGAVSQMEASGGTAMYDALLVGIKSVTLKAQALEEQGVVTSPVIFVLTDGDSNDGYDFKKTEKIIAGMKVPVYTISYNYANEVLADVAALNEAASITGTSDDIVYKLKSLFNSEI